MIQSIINKSKVLDSKLIVTIRYDQKNDLNYLQIQSNQNETFAKEISNITFVFRSNMFVNVYVYREYNLNLNAITNMSFPLDRLSMNEIVYK